MTESNSQRIDIPCPGCDYDLRAQIEPRCPECGMTFKSLDAIRKAHHGVHQVLMKAEEAKRKILYIIAAGFVVPLIGYLIHDYVFGVLFILLFGYAGIHIVVLAINSLFWIFDKHIQWNTRKELIYLLLSMIFFAIPTLLAGYAAYIIITESSPA